jgi:hypothetical protein
MGLAFGLEGAAILLLLLFRSSAPAFVAALLDRPWRRFDPQGSGCGLMKVATGSWTPVFGVAVAVDIATAALPSSSGNGARRLLGGRASSPTGGFAPAGASIAGEPPAWRTLSAIK